MNDLIKNLKERIQKLETSKKEVENLLEDEIIKSNKIYKEHEKLTNDSISYLRENKDIKWDDIDLIVNVMKENTEISKELKELKEDYSLEKQKIKIRISSILDCY